MLIPEIAKILRKNPVWDAIKLLLFKFGQSHPKLAATALLGGPAVITGALAIASKAVFRNTVRDAVKGILPSAGAAAGGTSLISKASTRISKGSASVFYSFNQMGDILNNAEQAYVDNKNWIKYLKDEEKTLQKKVLLGKASRLIQQNQTANALNNPAIAKNIAEALNIKTRKDGFEKNAISRCCKGKQSSHKRHKWYYKEDYDKLSEKDINIIQQRLDKEIKSKISLKNIVAVSTKSEEVLFFENSKQAVEDGFHYSHIHECCRGELKTHKGYRWYYKEDYDKMIKETD